MDEKKSEMVFDKKPPKREDFRSGDDYYEALEKFMESVPADRPISEEVYWAHKEHYGLEYLTDHIFKMGDNEYFASVLFLADGNPPDSTNIRVYIVSPASEQEN